MNVAKLAVIFIAIIIAATGCKNQSKNGEPPAAQKSETLLSIIDSENGQPIENVILGKSIRFVLELKNLTDQSITFHFPTGQQFDFEVRNETGKLVWNWAHDQVFIQAETILTLDADEQIKFTPAWNQKDNQGIQVPAGTYSVKGIITTTDLEQPENRKRTFTILSNQ